jgi:hypothetical protein
MREPQEGSRRDPAFVRKDHLRDALVSGAVLCRAGGGDAAGADREGLRPRFSPGERAFSSPSSSRPLALAHAERFGGDKGADQA